MNMHLSGTRGGMARLSSTALAGLPMCSCQSLTGICLVIMVNVQSRSVTSPILAASCCFATSQMVASARSCQA